MQNELRIGNHQILGIKDKDEKCVWNKVKVMQIIEIFYRELHDDTLNT